MSTPFRTAAAPASKNVLRSNLLRAAKLRRQMVARSFHLREQKRLHLSDLALVLWIIYNVIPFIRIFLFVVKFLGAAVNKPIDTCLKLGIVFGRFNHRLPG